MTNEEILNAVPPLYAVVCVNGNGAYCSKIARGLEESNQSANWSVDDTHALCTEAHVVKIVPNKPAEIVASYPKQPTPKVGQVWSCNRTFSYHTIVAVGRFETCMQHDHSLYLVQNERFKTEWTLVSEPKP